MGASRPAGRDHGVVLLHLVGLRAGLVCGSARRSPAAFYPRRAARILSCLRRRRRARGGRRRAHRAGRGRPGRGRGRDAHTGLGPRQRHLLRGRPAPLWSLSAEAFFYLLFPLLILGLVRARLEGAVDRRARRGDDRGRVVRGHRPPPGWAHDLALGRLHLPRDPAPRVRPRCDHRPRHAPTGARSPIKLGPALLLALAAYLAAGWVPLHFMWVATTIVPFAILVAAAATADIEQSPSWLRARPLVTLGAWSFCVLPAPHARAAPPIQVRRPHLDVGHGRRSPRRLHRGGGPPVPPRRATL